MSVLAEFVKELVPANFSTLGLGELQEVYNGTHSEYFARGQNHYALGEYIVDRLVKQQGVFRNLRGRDAQRSALERVNTLIPDRCHYKNDTCFNANGGRPNDDTHCMLNKKTHNCILKPQPATKPRASRVASVRRTPQPSSPRPLSFIELEEEREGNVEGARLRPEGQKLGAVLAQFKQKRISEFIKALRYKPIINFTGKDDPIKDPVVDELKWRYKRPVEKAATKRPKRVYTEDIAPNAPLYAVPRLSYANPLFSLDKQIAVVNKRLAAFKPASAPKKASAPKMGFKFVPMIDNSGLAALINAAQRAIPEKFTKKYMESRK